MSRLMGIVLLVFNSPAHAAEEPNIAENMLG